MWPSRTGWDASGSHDFEGSSKDQILTLPSHPPEANRLAGRGEPSGEESEPEETAGAHETEVTPRAWAGKREASQVPSSDEQEGRQHALVREARSGRHGALLKVRTETLPSELAQARIGPSSCGAHPIAFTV